MDIKQIKNELNDYYLYIRTIFINEFQKYINPNKLKDILNNDDVIELNEDLSFKIYIKDKIIFNLNIKKYVEENKLKEENSLKDLNECSKNYIEYILQNEENVFLLIKNKILHAIITYFVNEEKDVVSLGTISLIEKELASKYKLPTEKFFKSKEEEVASYVSLIVGKEILYTGVINNNPSFIASNYNLYTENDESYQLFTKKLNKIYNEYSKKVGKIYLPDSLYEYENLNYNLQEKTKKINEEKKNNNLSRLKRLMSINESLLRINNYYKHHQILLTVLEKKELENFIYEINKIFEKIKKDGKEQVPTNVSNLYKNIIEVENESMKFAIKLWQNTLTSPESYKLGKDFNFLISNSDKGDIAEGMLISSEHLKNIKTLKSTYGFIYEPVDDSIIYCSTETILYKKFNKDNYIENYNTIYVNGIPIEIDNQSVSKLITPDMIIKDNLKNKTIQNKILLDKKKVRRVGIYCFVDEDYENNPNYNKALELSDNYELPVVPINKDIYFNGIEPTKIEVKIKENYKEEKKESIFSRIKNSMYEEEYKDFKKTL